MVVFCAVLVMMWGVVKEFCTLGILFLCLLTVGLFYCPVSLETTDHTLIIHRVLKDKVIPYSEIAAADYCYPSAGGLRLCGSGGFMGYWGYFHDIIIGNYFGYYGNQKNCILIKLNSGKQYVLGCEDREAILNIIFDKIGE